MKKIFVFLAICLFHLGAQSQISYYLSNKFWRLKHAVINGREYPLAGNSNAPTLQFSGGSIRGNGGCNAYHTKFTINGNSLQIDKIMSTRMACNSLELDESEYFNAMAQSHTLEYEEGSSEFRLINTSNDMLIFYSQFERNPSSYTPPPSARRERVVHYDDDDRPALNKKQTRRKADLEKKQKRGKLTKAERRELIKLQSKAKLGKVKGRKGKSIKGKKGRKGRGEARKSKKGSKKTKAKASKKKRRR